MKIGYGKHFPVGCPNKLMGNFHLFSLNLDPLLFLLLCAPSSPLSFCTTLQLLAAVAGQSAQYQIAQLSCWVGHIAKWNSLWSLAADTWRMRHMFALHSTWPLDCGLWTNARHRWHKGGEGGVAKGVQTGGKRKWAAMIFWRTPDWARSSMHYFNGWLAQKFRACLTCCCYSCCCCCCPTQF